VYGVEVSDWRLPVDFAYAPRHGQGQVNVHDTTAQAAAGRLAGRASWSWGLGNRLEGSLHFFDLQLRPLLRQAADLSQSGSGRITGRVDFSGADMASVNDLRATLDATLQQTQAMSFPVLAQLVPFLGPGSSGSAMFTSGDLKARLAGGTVRVQRLSLQGSLLQLWVEGTVTLQGRLGLDVTASTGVRVTPGLLRALGLRLPLTVGPIPIGLLTQASTMLSAQLLHLRVGGTVRSPIIQVEPVSLLTQEALLFFLSRTAPP
jgi:hypothetical protein